MDGRVNPSYSVPGVGGLVGRSGIGAEITTEINEGFLYM